MLSRSTNRDSNSVTMREPIFVKKKHEYQTELWNFQLILREKSELASDRNQFFPYSRLYIFEISRLLSFTDIMQYNIVMSNDPGRNPTPVNSARAKLEEVKYEDEPAITYRFIGCLTCKFLTAMKWVLSLLKMFRRRINAKFAKKNLGEVNGCVGNLRRNTRDKFLEFVNNRN